MTSSINDSKSCSNNTALIKDPIGSSYFPSLVKVNIIAFIAIDDLDRCAQVSKAWNAVVYNESVWEKLVQHWNIKHPESQLPIVHPLTRVCLRGTVQLWTRLTAGGGGDYATQIKEIKSFRLKD